MDLKLGIIVGLLCGGFAGILIIYGMHLDKIIKSEKIYNFLTNIFGFMLIAGILLLFTKILYIKNDFKEVINDENESVNESVYSEMGDIELYNQMMILEQLNNLGSE